LRLEASALVEMLSREGVHAEADEAEELLRMIRDLDARHHEERRLVQRLAKAAPVIELPYLFTPSFGPAEVETLSRGIAA
jgi:hypothetical protein